MFSLLSPGCVVPSAALSLFLYLEESCGGVAPRYQYGAPKYGDNDSHQFHSLIFLGILCSDQEPFQAI